MAPHIQTVRNPPPRMLAASETLHSLNYWSTACRTYYHRDSYFKSFLLPNAAWTNYASNNYGQRAETNGQTVIRSAEDNGEDLQEFLNSLADYLPFPYLTERLQRVV